MHPLCGAQTPPLPPLLAALGEGGGSPVSRAHAFVLQQFYQRLEKVICASGRRGLFLKGRNPNSPELLSRPLGLIDRHSAGSEGFRFLGERIFWGWPALNFRQLWPSHGMMRYIAAF